MRRKEKFKKIPKSISREDRKKINSLIARGFVFTGKARVCGHCDHSCTD